MAQLFIDVGLGELTGDGETLRSAFIKINDVDVSMTGKSISHVGNDYFLNLSNDSITMQINLGADGNVGNFNILSNGTTCNYNFIDYPNINNGISAISLNDTENQLLSGFFQLDFYRTDFSDTLHITEGQFDYLPY